MGTLSVDKLLRTSTGASEFTLPATDGTVGQVMQTDGSGQLSIAALAADTVGTSQISALAVDTAEIAANAVDGTKIAMGSDTIGDMLYYNGTDTTFTLTNSVGTPASIIVSISGVKQIANTAYSVSGTTLDFGVGNPPPAGTNTLEVVYLGLKADPSPIQDQTLGLNAIMRTNAQTISENLSVASTVNAMSAGPITISDSYIVTVNGYWSIV